MNIRGWYYYLKPGTTSVQLKFICNDKYIRNGYVFLNGIFSFVLDCNEKVLKFEMLFDKHIMESKMGILCYQRKQSHLFCIIIAICQYQMEIWASAHWDLCGYI